MAEGVGNMSNLSKAIELLQENIEAVAPHGCQRDEVLALLLLVEEDQALLKILGHLPRRHLDGEDTGTVV
jgi:hypothetical protein